MDRPNILLIFADQHRWDCVGANGHPFLQTPHLDRLAAEGTNFTHAFTPTPVCVPARTSLLFGCWPSRHLAVTNPGTDAPRGAIDGLPSFSRQLRDGGYWLGFVGKWDVDRGRGPERYGFHEYLSDRHYGAWREAEGLPPRPRGNGWFGEVDLGVAPDQTRLGWGASRTIELLETHAAQRAGQPFFVRWDPSEVHLPNVVPEPYASLYPPESIPPWPSFGDTFEGKPYIQAQQLRTWGLNGWTWDQWAPIVSRYLGEISLLDAQIGRVLDALHRLGLADDTLVVYTCDHGDTCGGHGMIDKHFILYDELVRVPCIVRWPAGHRTPGAPCDAFVSTGLDLAPTFCELAGVGVPDTFQGQSLAAPPRQDIFATYSGSQFGMYSQRMVRDRHWKYVWNATAEDELYDLAADPGELRNLARCPAQASELARLRGRLVAWMEDTGDLLLNGWTREQLLDGRKV